MSSKMFPESTPTTEAGQPNKPTLDNLHLAVSEVLSDDTFFLVPNTADYHNENLQIMFQVPINNEIYLYVPTSVTVESDSPLDDHILPDMFEIPNEKMYLWVQSCETVETTPLSPLPHSQPLDLRPAVRRCGSGSGVMEVSRGDFSKNGGDSYKGNGGGIAKMYNNGINGTTNGSGSDQQQFQRSSLNSLKKTSLKTKKLQKNRNNNNINNSLGARLTNSGYVGSSNNRNGMSGVNVKGVLGGSGGGRYSSSGGALSELIVSRYAEYVDDDDVVNGGSGGYYEENGGDDGGDGAYLDQDDYMDYEGQDEYDEYDNDGSGYLVDNNGNDEDDEYPDTLQYCEAQFDEGGLEDDEEARGLPPPPSRGNYDDGDSPSGNASNTRITTNECGIRIVESSTILEPEGEDDVEYDRYGDYGADNFIPMSSFLPSAKRTQNNLYKTRKMRPEKAAAEAILRQLRNSELEYTPNILAKKLMGVPSQAVQPSRPPPLTKKPVKLMQQQQQKPQQISLESILRQKQRPQQVQNFSSRPKSNSLLLNHTQLKIKSSHAIPSTTSISLSSVRQQTVSNNKCVSRYQQSNDSSPSARLFLTTPPSSSTQKSSMIRSSPKVQNFQQFQQQQQQKTSAQFRARSLGTEGASSNNIPRLSISSIQQQLQSSQKNGLSMKPLKNVPRCHVCNRTFATNQVLQRHMALHGPAATYTDSDMGELKCDICHEQFEATSQLARHFQSAHSERPSAIASTSPPSTSSSQQGLHRCRVCYRTFTSMESLSSHSTVHEGNLKCRACRRGFSDLESLEEHEATHKRYSCQWCDKYFMNSGNLKAHERIHTGERPYKCNDCPKAFKQLGGLQYHLKTNPAHQPQKYHKGELDGTDPGNNGSSNGDSNSASGSAPAYIDASMLQYESGGEDYDDGGMSILDLATGAGY